MPCTLDEAGLCWLLTDHPVPTTDPTLDQFATAHQFTRAAWQLAPVLVPRICTWAERVAPAEDLAGLRALSTAVRTLGAVQLSLARRVTDSLTAAGVPHCLMKGSAVRIVGYDDPNSRCGLDVDLAVPAEYLEAAEHVIVDHGFLAGSLLEGGRHFRTVSEQERAEVEASHYELACLVRRQRIHGVRPDVRAAIENSMSVLRPWHQLDDDIACYVTLDVHHGICLDIAVDEMVSQARVVAVADGKVHVPTLPWMAFHVIFKLYWEGVHNYRKGAYQYADLIRLLARSTDEDDRQLVDLLERWSLDAAGHYTLRRLPTDFAVALSDPLARFVEQTRSAPVDCFPSDANDIGDMWPKLWGHR
jgi:hypothetical protein